MEDRPAPLNHRDRRRLRRRRGSRGTGSRPLGAWDLSSMSCRAGEDYAIEFDAPGERHAVLDGHLGIDKLGVDLQIHTGDAVEMESAHIDIVLPPGFTVSVLLEGRIDAMLDGVPLRMRATSSPDGHLWYHRRPVRLRRRLQAGVRNRKVHVSVASEALLPLVHDGHGPASAAGPGALFDSDETLPAPRTPSRHTMRLAESILVKLWSRLVALDAVPFTPRASSSSTVVLKIY